jgi:hypothetical protein
MLADAKKAFALDIERTPTQLIAVPRHALALHSATIPVVDPG